MAVRGPSETLRARAIDGGGPQKLRAEGEGRTHRNVQGRSGTGGDGGDGGTGGDGGDGGHPSAPALGTRCWSRSPYSRNEPRGETPRATPKPVASGH